MDGLLLLSRGVLYVYVYASYVSMLIRGESSQRRSELYFLRVVEVFLMLYKPPSIFQYHHTLGSKPPYIVSFRHVRSLSTASPAPELSHIGPI